MATDAQLNIVVNATDKASAQLSTIGDKIGGMAKIAGTAVLGAGAAIAAFSTQAILHFSDVGDAVEKMSSRTGLSAESVSALRVAADASGTSIEAVEGAVKKMSLNFKDASSITGDLKDALTGVGLSADDFSGAKVDTKFEMLASAIGSVQDPAEKTRLAVKAFGKAGADLIPLFQDGNFSMQDWSDQAKKLGVSFDDLSAKRAADLNDALGAVKNVVSGLSLAVGGELAPYVTKFINDVVIPAAPILQKLAHEGFDFVKNAVVSVAHAVDGLWAYLQQTGVITAIEAVLKGLWNTVQTQLVPAFSKLWVAIQPLMPYLQTLGKFVGGALVVALLAAIGTINLVVSAISTLIEWVAKAITGFEEFGGKVTSVWSGIYSTVSTVVGQIQKLVNDLLNSWSSMVKTVSSPISSSVGAVKGAIGGAISSVSKAITGKATGGPVSGGTPYFVGEQGPELFVPSSSGSIVPNGSLGGIGGISVTVNTGAVNSQLDMRQLGNTIGDAIMHRLKAQLKF